MLSLYTYTSDQYRSRTGLLNRDRIYHMIGVLSEIWDFPWRLEKTGSVSTLQGGALVVVPVPAAPGIVHCTVRTTVSITFAPAAAVLRILGFWVVRTSVFRDVSLSLAPGVVSSGDGSPCLFLLSPARATTAVPVLPTLATVCPRFITVRVIAVAMHVTRATHLPSLALHLLKLPPDVGRHRVQVVVAAAAVGPCGWPRQVHKGIERLRYFVYSRSGLHRPRARVDEAVHLPNPGKNLHDSCLLGGGRGGAIPRPHHLLGHV
mmetsp:Transcript_6478/g.16126  ORF Transcript_6478/g.16126 Transcript_6478/m.16126 type:complete len:262 (+) Transcript_6478:90-875(+)